jgi:hypothetical protein
MPKVRRLLDKDITLSQAKADETNVLHKLTYWDQRLKFFAHLYHRRSILQAIAAHHLGLRTDVCRVAELDDWLHGSFNVCVPVAIDSGGRPQVIIRIPLPYRVGYRFRPGNADEKLRCQAGAYAWVEQHCPNVPIPKLYGFGLSTGQTV